jgi:hypothetical protein
MLITWTGQAAPADGLYADEHGHRLFLRSGELAPICVFSGSAVMRWRLIQQLGPIAA